MARLIFGYSGPQSSCATRVRTLAHFSTSEGCKQQKLKEELVSLTGIEPAFGQFSWVQLGLSRYVFSPVQFATRAFKALRVAGVVCRWSVAVMHRPYGRARSPLRGSVRSPLVATPTPLHQQVWLPILTSSRTATTRRYSTICFSERCPRRTRSPSRWPTAAGIAARCVSHGSGKVG